MTESAKYIPGVCNIGRAEIRRRKLLGWLALAVTLATWLALAIFETARPWRLALVVPASIAATGFLQAAGRFCATYGMLGRANVGSNVGKTDTIEQAEFRRQDRRKAMQLVMLSLLTGAVVAAAAWFIPPM